MNNVLMNIYAKEDDQVIYQFPDNGYHHHQQTAQKYLIIGQVYTVSYTDIHNLSTNVYLKEFPQIRFNSVLFSDYKDE